MCVQESRGLLSLRVRYVSHVGMFQAWVVDGVCGFFQWCWIVAD